MTGFAPVRPVDPRKNNMERLNHLNGLGMKNGMHE
jgi:hypothetical protein